MIGIGQVWPIFEKFHFFSTECPYIEENSVCGKGNCICTCKPGWTGDKCQGKSNITKYLVQNLKDIDAILLIKILWDFF